MLSEDRIAQIRERIATSTITDGDGAANVALLLDLYMDVPELLAELDELRGLARDSIATAREEDTAEIARVERERDEALAALEDDLIDGPLAVWRN